MLSDNWVQDSNIVSIGGHHLSSDASTSVDTKTTNRTLATDFHFEEGSYPDGH